MAAPTWITYNSFLGTITQRTLVEIPFTATGTVTNFSVIAGSLPAGLELQVATTSTTTAAPTPGIVYFKVTDGVGRNDFVIKLTDPVKIQNARDQLNGVVPKLHITGLIIKSTVDYNPNYSYHYDPDTIDFFEYAMEVCDATFNYTEENLADAGGAFLPGLRLCPWGSLLVEEVSLTPATTTGFIFGFAESVPTDITSKFVIRAKNTDGVTDKTFSIKTTGAINPLWITPEGYLSVGTSYEYFAINNQIVDYQLIAEPNTLHPGMSMHYYIEEGDGDLPNGLRLNDDGRIVGTIKEITAQSYEVQNDTGFDGTSHDGFPYDINAVVDGVSNKPKFVPKIYQFYVTASDGFNVTKRLFKIHVVDANSLRGDTTYIYADAEYFLASDSFLFSPTWLNPANLGIRRAANYQIIPIKLYDPTPDAGPVVYEWDMATVNPEIRATSNTAYTEGLEPITGETLYIQSNNRAGDTVLYLKDLTTLPTVGQQFRLDSYIEGASTTTYTISDVNGTVDECELGFKHNERRVWNSLTNSYDILYDTDLQDDVPPETILFMGSASEHPKGFQLDTETGNLYGQIPFIPAYSVDYKFTIRMTRSDPNTSEVRRYDRVFSLRMQGSLDNELEWISTATIGLAKTGYQSELFVKAQNKYDLTQELVYTFVDGELPPGYTFKGDGTIVGKIPYKNSITTVDEEPLDLDFMLDGGISTIDRSYTFTVQASDIYHLNTIDKTFTIKIGDNALTPYSTLYVKPFMYRDKRRTYRDFITDTKIFSPKVLYRPNDPAFGLQQEIRLIIEHGLETLNLAEYVLGFQEYFYNKRFFFGDVKTLPAKDDDGNYVYDVVYVDIVDSQMVASRSPNNMQFFINKNLANYSIASLDNWQRRLESIPILGRTIKVDEYLRPRFMRTIQKATGAPLGFIKAVPLCYCKPGNGSTVVKKVNLSGFDFKLLDFEVDRLIINNTIDFSVDKYLKFPITSVDSPRPIDVIAGPDGVILQTEDGISLFTE